MRFSFAPGAVEDGIVAREWYALADSTREADFNEELRRVAERIAEFPESGHPYLAGTRRMLLRGFPYFVVYRLRRDDCLVVAIAHFRQESGFWLDRP